MSWLFRNVKILRVRNFVTGINSTRFTTLTRNGQIHKLNEVYRTKLPNITIRQPHTLENLEKMLFTPFEKIAKKVHIYWIVGFPLHIINSMFWLYISYYMNHRGFDIVRLFRRMVTSKEDFLEHFRKTYFGHITLTFVLFKILAPVRHCTSLYLTIKIARRILRSNMLMNVYMKQQIKK